MFFQQPPGYGTEPVARVPANATVRAIIPASAPVIVRTAMDFVALMDQATRKASAYEGGAGGWRDMTPVEEGAYEAALGACAAYFAGKALPAFRDEVKTVDIVNGARS